MLDNFQKIQLFGKRPIFNNYLTDFKPVDVTKNYGILTGKINNIIVVDIDIKDNGLTKWNELINKHSEPDTFTIRTGSGGLHYYFKYNENISNAIKINIDDGCYGIDIFTDNKFIVGPGSTHPITNAKYKIINNSKITDISEWLLKIISKQTKKQKVKKQLNNKLKISDKIFEPISDNYLIKLLNKLDKIYCDNYYNWLTITNICKFHNKKIVWDKWSKSSSSYDAENNNMIWNNIIPSFDINYICNILKVKLVKYTKQYHPLTENEFKTINVNEKYIEFEIKDKYNTYIIKSDTGTGKTTATSKVLKNEEHILSIVSRCSLVEQHIASFAKQDVTLISYKKNVKSNKLCCQLDSILKYNTKNIKNTTVYIDEINSLLGYLINSSTLNNKRCKILQQFNFIVRNCKNIICTDADISDLVFIYFRIFRDVDKSIFINNKHKNYIGIKAYEYLEFKKLANKMKNEITNDIGFVACFDEKRTMKRLFEYLYDENKKEKFIKISSEDCDKIDTNNWIDKFVFYTPKIIYGNSFEPKIKTNIFIFAKGSTIDPLQISQQMTRCRNIKSINYNFDTTDANLKYENLNNCKHEIKTNLDNYIDMLKYYNCVITDDFGNNKIVENAFFNMFVYYQYINDLICSNYNYHFKEILKTKGFILETIGSKRMNISKIEKCELDNLAENRFDEQINNYLAQENINISDEFAQSISDRIHMLNLTYGLDENDPEYNNILRCRLIKYKSLIFKTNKLNTHFNLCKFLKSDNLIKDSFKYDNDMHLKKVRCINAKLLVINNLLNKLNINKFDIDTNQYIDRFDEPTNFTKTDYKFVNSVFNKRNPSKYANNFKFAYDLLITAYKNIDTNMILTNKKQINGKRFYNHKINTEYIKNCIDLYKLRDPNMQNINSQAISIFGIKDTGIFID